MQILNSWTEESQGRIFLYVETDLAELVIFSGDQKWLLSHGLLYAGSEAESALPEIVLPPDRQDNRASLTLRGFTADPRVVDLFHKAMAGTLSDEVQ